MVTGAILAVPIFAGTVVAAVVVAPMGFARRPVALLLAVAAVRLAFSALVAVLAVLVELLAFGHLALRLAQHAGVVLGVLQKGLFGHAVARQLRVTRQRQVFVDDLLGRPAHLALGARAVEDAVDDVAQRALAVRLVARAGFR